MLAKNRATAFINTLVAFGFFLLSYAAVSLAFTGQALPPLDLNIWVILFLVAIFLVLVYFLSGSLLVMGLDDNVGFGWKGLVRWAAYGLVVGSLLSLLSSGVLSRMKENSIFYNIVEYGGGFTIIAVAYWLIFRISIFKVGGEKANAEQGINYLSWYFIIGGSIVALAGWVVLLGGTIKSALTLEMVLGSAAVIMIGLGSILMGAILKIQDDNKLATRIFLLVVGLIVVGVVIALIASLFS